MVGAFPIAAVSAADLVVMNGLGLDDWLVRVINAANPDVPVVRLAEDLPGVDYVTGEAGEAVNPHLWLDVSNGARYAGKIADALATFAADEIVIASDGSPAEKLLSRARERFTLPILQSVESLPHAA